jgi:glycosyltransferase involved in cell wall biosynthesis
VETYIINGKFLTQRMTGVQRFAYELVSALDGLIESSDRIKLGVPLSTKNTLSLRAIPVVVIGTHQGVRWEQCDFPAYCRKQHAIPVNLCNAAPLRNPGVVCIHDVKVKRFPRYFNGKFRVWYEVMFRRIASHARCVLTVSEFSKREIMETLRIPETRIFVIPDSWQHLAKVVPDPDVLERYHVQDKRFFFMLGSLEPNKNLSWIANEARMNSNETFLVSGNIDVHVFASDKECTFPPNVRFIGYASDEEVKGLMKHCKALLFPSFYEGFGVPPLEALSVGAPVIVSDIPVLKEIYRDAALYIDPHRNDYRLQDLLAVPTNGAEAVLETYSWEASARKLLSVLREGIQS